MDQLRNDNRLAIFIDAENIVIEAEKAGIPFALDPVIGRLREEGQIVFANAYGDWAAPPLFNYRRQFRQNVVELQEVATDQRGKNTADIKLAVDALEMVLLPHAPDIIVLLTGDRDLVPLVQKVKRYGKTVLGIGIKGSTSSDLEQACNTFLYLDDMYQPMRETPPVVEEPAPRAISVRRVKPVVAPPPVPRLSENLLQERTIAFHLLVRAVSILDRQGKAALGSTTRQLMQQLDSTFSPDRLGFTSFKDFVTAAVTDDYVFCLRPNGETADFMLELNPHSPAGMAPAPRNDIEEETIWRCDTPELARNSYRQILLTKKRVPLVSWVDRQSLVNRLWQLFTESKEAGLTIDSMTANLKAFARQQQMRIPDLAIEKITQTLNIARCFVSNGQPFYQHDLMTPVMPSVDAVDALDAMNSTYVRAITFAVPMIQLLPEGIALLLFDEINEITLDRAKRVVNEVEGRSGDTGPTAMQLAFQHAGIQK